MNARGNISAIEGVCTVTIFDICKRLAAQEHIDSPGVTEAVNGMYRFQPLWRQGFGEIFAADAIDAASGELSLR